MTEFNRDLAEKLENSVLAEAIQKAIRFLDHNELPPHWEKSSLFHSHNVDSESDENFSDVSFFFFFHSRIITYMQIHNCRAPMMNQVKKKTVSWRNYTNSWTKLVHLSIKPPLSRTKT